MSDLPAGITEENGRKFVDAIVRKNQKQAAEEIGVDPSTVSRYKRLFQGMNPVQRNLVIIKLALQNLFEALRVESRE